jgi:hypothetical protein
MTVSFVGIFHAKVAKEIRGLVFIPFAEMPLRSLREMPFDLEFC